MIKGRIISKIKNNGSTKYESNIRLLPEDIADPKPLRHLKPITILENKINLYRHVSLDSKDEDIIKLLQLTLIKLEQKLNDFIPHCKNENQKFMELLSIIRELGFMYHELGRTKRVPDTEYWLYNKFRDLMDKIKSILLKLKEEVLE